MIPGKEKCPQKHQTLMHLDGTGRERDREIYLQLLHSSLCWRWEKEEEREVKGGREPDSCFKIGNSSDNTHTHTHKHVYMLDIQRFHSLSSV